MRTGKERKDLYFNAAAALAGGDAPLYEPVFSADNKFLIISGLTQTYIIDLLHKKPISVPPESGVIISPDGQNAIIYPTGSSTPPIIVIDLSTGKIIETLPDNTSFSDFSADSRLIIFQTGQILHFWDVGRKADRATTLLPNDVATQPWRTENSQYLNADFFVVDDSSEATDPSINDPTTTDRPTGPGDFIIFDTNTGQILRHFAINAPLIFSSDGMLMATWATTETNNNTDPNGEATIWGVPPCHW